MSLMYLALWIILPLITIWVINRAVSESDRSRLIALIFWTSALLPVLALIGWYGMWYVPFMVHARTLPPLDPKFVPMLLAVGLPLSLITAAIAYWGSKGRTT
ncbi:hypothetical protein [Sphingobium aquiterrae]|uniref:hypothetical protein n=1 Tax=Sphingobium aquiterrae TaxID=2038656 RepID=UPI00301A8C22